MVFQFSILSYLDNCLGDDDSIFVQEYLSIDAVTKYDEEVFKPLKKDWNPLGRRELLLG